MTASSLLQRQDILHEYVKRSYLSIDQKFDDKTILLSI